MLLFSWENGTVASTAEALQIDLLKRTVECRAEKLHKPPFDDRKKIATSHQKQSADAAYPATGEQKLFRSSSADAATAFPPTARKSYSSSGTQQLEGIF